MSKTKITAPVEGYEGRGPGDAEFKDGVAYTDNEAAINYYRQAGYGVGSGKAEKPDTEPVVDARDAADTKVVGTALRDAAVDPKPDDFLAPTNAGKADPHGPLVVSPGIHAIETQVVRPGEVHVGDPAKQDEAETEQAKRLLVDNEDVGDVTAADPDAGKGPLGLSDPGSVELGVKAAKAVAKAEAKQAPAEGSTSTTEAKPAAKKAAAKKTAARKATAKKATPAKQADPPAKS